MVNRFINSMNFTLEFVCLIIYSDYIYVLNECFVGVHTNRYVMIWYVKNEHCTPLEIKIESKLKHGILNVISYELARLNPNQNMVFWMYIHMN